jgi:hypothetical protein
LKNGSKHVDYKLSSIFGQAAPFLELKIDTLYTYYSS